MRILKIGILSYKELKERNLAIAKGDYIPSEDDPKVWFTSEESFSQIIGSNRLLLEIMVHAQPTTISDLAKKANRRPSNVSRTLKTLEQYGVVKMVAGKGNKKKPVFPYDGYKVEQTVTFTKPEQHPS
ncbi:HVO_A0114 family putative DNA-binding protein [Magnetococcales bacterium HHB-1]